MRATVFGSSLLQLLTGRRMTRHTPAAKTTLPGISLIVRVGTDDPRLPAVMASLNSLDYPDDKLDIVFIAEGPAGHTGAILRMTSNPMPTMMGVIGVSLAGVFTPPMLKPRAPSSFFQ